MMDVTRAARLFAALEDVRKEATSESQRLRFVSTTEGMDAVAASLARLVRGKRGRGAIARKRAIELAVRAVRYAAECTDYSPPIGKGDEVSR